MNENNRRFIDIVKENIKKAKIREPINLIGTWPSGYIISFRHRMKLITICLYDQSEWHSRIITLPKFKRIDMFDTLDNPDFKGFWKELEDIIHQEINRRDIIEENRKFKINKEFIINIMGR